MQGRHIILNVTGRGYIKAGTNLSYQFTNNPTEARAFPERQVWHEEKELNAVKNDLDNQDLSYEEEIFEWQSYRR